MPSKNTYGCHCCCILPWSGHGICRIGAKGPITLQIGFGSGSSTDTISRATATLMVESTGWDVIVENKPGGGGIAMFSSFVRQDADGTTLGMGVTIPTLMNLATRGGKLPFQAVSFDYLATIVLAPLALVAP